MMRSILASLFITLLLTACGSDPGDAPASESPPANPEVAQPAPAPQEEPADVAAMAGPATSADVCADLTEDAIQSVIPDATAVVTQESQGVGMVGCRGTFDLDGASYTYSVSYQADATDAAGFERIMKNQEMMAENVDGLEAPIAVPALGDAAFTQGGTGGTTRVLVGEGLWMSSVTEGAENHAEHALAILRAVLDAEAAP